MRSASVPCGLNSSSQLAGQVLPLELLVLADVGRNHLLDLPRLEQHAEAELVDAGVVGNHGEAAHAGFAQREDQVLRDAAQAEAAAHDRHAVAHHAGERGCALG